MMHSTIGKEDWEALVEVLQEAIQLLNGRQTEPVKLKILEFSSTAAMLELEDLAGCGKRFEDFLLTTVAPSWNEEATATLSFAMGALVEKMQLSTYSPEFSSGLGEVLMYLDFYDAEEPGAPASSSVPLETGETVSTVPGAEPSPVENRASEQARPVSDTMGSSDATPQAPVDWDSVLEGIVEEVNASGKHPTAAEPTVTTPASATAPAGVAAPARRPSIPIPAGAEGFVVDRLDWYREVLREDPQSRLFTSLAEELCVRGLWEEAAACCRQGLLHHPASLRGRVLLGRALWEVGETVESRRVLLEAHREVAANADLYGLLAKMAEHDQEHLLAEDYLRTLRFLEAEHRRLVEEPGVLGSPVESARPSEPVSIPAVEAEVDSKPAGVQEWAEESVEPPAVPAWLLRLQETYECMEAVEPVIDPLFSDEDRAVLRGLLRASLS